MNKKFLHSLQLILASLDFLVVNTIFFSTVFIFRNYFNDGFESSYIYFGFFLNIVWLATIALTNIYREENILSFEVFTKSSFKAYLYFLLVVTVFLLFFHLLIITRGFLSVILVAIPIALLINRFFYLSIIKYFREKIWIGDKVLIVGYNSLSKKLVRYLEEDAINKKIIGYCEEYENVNELSHYPILSDISGAIDVCKQYGATEIYSTIAPEHNLSIYHLIQSAEENCIRIKIVPDFSFFVKNTMHLEFLKEIPLLMPRLEPLEDMGSKIKKRFFDVVISLLVIVFILSWLLPIIAILIKLESRGPAFFSQLRTGKDKKPFVCMKFRSMRVNDFAHAKQATKNDERVTRIGRFLRKTSIDEFPQFFNVLIGDMSIVGPRPHMLKHTDEYSKVIGKYMVRQFLKPGITGWAQVNGYRGETTNLLQMQKRVDYDLWYMENWTIYLDLKIFFLTIFNVMKGEKQAY